MLKKLSPSQLTRTTPAPPKRDGRKKEKNEATGQNTVAYLATTLLVVATNLCGVY